MNFSAHPRIVMIVGPDKHYKKPGPTQSYFIKDDLQIWTIMHFFLYSSCSKYSNGIVFAGDYSRGDSGCINLSQTA